MNKLPNRQAMAAKLRRERQQDIVGRYLAGAFSAEMALMYLLQAAPDLREIELALEAGMAVEPGEDMARRSTLLKKLGELALENHRGCDRIAGMLRSGMDTDKPAASVDEGIAFCERLFDWSVRQCAEASVALYSLGNPEILDVATAEIVRLMRQRRLLGPARDLLEIGCGIGRFQQALAPEVRTITGIDVSANMVGAARTRCATCANASFHHCSGRDLAMFDSGTFDLVYAVDAFPYIFQSGMALVEKHFSEVRRVLKPGGDFLILEFSYHRSLEADQRDVNNLAAGMFEILLAGTRPFELWDGAAFHLRALPVG